MNYILYLYKKKESTLTNDGFFTVIEKISKINHICGEQWLYINSKTNAYFGISIEDKGKGKQFNGFTFMGISFYVNLERPDDCGKESFAVIDVLLEKLDLYVASRELCDSPTRYNKGEIYADWSMKNHNILVEKKNYRFLGVKEPQETPEQRVRRWFDTNEKLWGKIKNKIKRNIIIKAFFVGLIVLAIGITRMNRRIGVIGTDIYFIAAIVIVVAVVVVINRFRTLRKLDDNQLSRLKDIYAKKLTRKLKRTTKAKLDITCVEKLGLDNLRHKGYHRVHKLVLNEQWNSLSNRRTLYVIIKNKGSAKVVNMKYAYWLYDNNTALLYGHKDFAIQTRDKGKGIIWPLEIYDVKPTSSLILNISCENDIGFSRIFKKRFYFNMKKQHWEYDKSNKIVVKK